MRRISAPYCSMTSCGARHCPGTSTSCAVFRHHEAMRQHSVIGRATACATAFQQRGMEPAAMLVRAFEIQRRRPARSSPLFQHEGMGRAGIEPDIENVRDLLVIVGIVVVAKEPLAGRGEPGIGTFFFERLRMRSITALIAQGSPVSLLTKTVIGTPQARWRDSTQSGRSRSCRAGGSRPMRDKRVSSMALSAFSRRPFVPSR